ncbi:LmbE family protein [Candidatus Aerophobetes bacterium Ae_b3a]|nr:PIG-L family deacetylase [Candidatus Aerophobetes bacterium]TKJ46617.1 MAG: LmbE family protein [Candidatus Aerophobetes bacterium Ae_b3a]
MKKNELHIMAIGAHAGDMELTAGGIMAKYAQEGGRITFVHLTPGEKGHPKLSSQKYAEQKIKEGEQAAKILNAEVRFLPYEDGELLVSEEVKYAICDIIRELKPDIILTHWKGSIHKDHIDTYYNVIDGIFYAGLPAIKRKFPAHYIGGLYFPENWEDPQGYKPTLYLDITKSYQTWIEAISQYAFARGEVSGFLYIDYYKSLAVVRGVELGFKYAEAFMVPEMARKRRLQFFPTEDIG